MNAKINKFDMWYVIKYNAKEKYSLISTFYIAIFYLLRLSQI